MREAFEKWAVEQAGQHNYYYTNLLLTKDENANYCTTWVDSAWRGWQACWEYHNDNH